MKILLSYNNILEHSETTNAENSLEPFWKGTLMSKIKAVFIDRDGTINQEKEYVSRVEDFGMIIGSSVVLVQVSIVGRLISEKVSRLIEKVSRLTGRKTI